ncbi:MAG: (deoxy)nucleoside triphosphate pyrophosphohydrolase [Methylotenera sp.]|nr:(deoxy)nucleoside triphosphate pyrophosphohydrolase [Methylotenera sp.]
MKHIEVVAAVIYKGNKILCVQRGKHKFDYISLKFEFPGGKIEIGETKEDALIREIKEELEMNIEIQKEFLTVFFEYPDFKITMHSFICICNSDVFSLKEHVEFKWLLNTELGGLDWASADIPIVEKLQSQK